MRCSKVEAEAAYDQLSANWKAGQSSIRHQRAGMPDSNSGQRFRSGDASAFSDFFSRCSASISPPGFSGAGNMHRPLTGAWRGSSCQVIDLDDTLHGATDTLRCTYAGGG